MMVSTSTPQKVSKWHLPVSGFPPSARTIFTDTVVRYAIRARCVAIALNQNQQLNVAQCQSFLNVWNKGMTLTLLFLILHRSHALPIRILGFDGSVPPGLGGNLLSWLSLRLSIVSPAMILDSQWLREVRNVDNAQAFPSIESQPKDIKTANCCDQQCRNKT